MAPKSNFGHISILDMTHIAMSTVLISVCAWISFPGIVVPFTLQTFAVFLSLLLLGGKLGTYAVILYLMMGSIGVPVFSGATGGIGVLLGCTGGYVLGLLGIAIVYRIITNIFGNSIKTSIIACIMGILSCYLIGATWYLLIYIPRITKESIVLVLFKCIIPFVLPDIIKIILAVFFSQRLKQYLRT